MRTRLVALLGALALTIPSLSVAQDRTVVQTGSVLDTLPANTTLVVSVPNMSALVSKIEASPIYKLKDDEQFAGLVTQFKQMLEQMRQEARSEANVDPVAMMESITGEMVMTVGDLSPIIRALGEAAMNMEEPKMTSGMVPFMVSVDVGSNLPTFKENLQSLIAAAVRDGAQIKTDKFHGGRITSMRPSGNGGDPDFDGLFVAEHGSKFLFGLQQKQIEETMVALGGEKPASALTKDEKFTFSHSQAGKGGDLFAFVNLRPVLAAVNEAMAQNPFVFVWQAAESILFGKSFNNIAVSYGLEPEGIRAKVFVHNSGAGDGILGWFKGKPFEAAPPGLIPDDSILYASSSFNAEAMNNTIRKIIELVQSFTAIQGESFDFEGMFEQQTGVPFKSFLSSFGERLHYFVSNPPSENNPVGDFNLVLELKDQEVWTKLLDKLVAESGGALQPKKYMNRDVYSSDVPIPDFAGASPTLCVTDNRLLFGFQRENVEKVIRRIGKDVPGLGDKAAFKKATSQLPSKVSALTYSSREYSASSVQMIEALADSPDFPTEEIPPELFQLIAAIAKQMDDSVGYALWNDQGYFAESNAPYRK